MATAAITERRKYSWGSLKMETGKFTGAAGTSALLITKLRRIFFFEIQSLGTVEDNDVNATWNSSTGSDVAGGQVFINATGISNGDYIYTVYGKG